MTYSGHFLELQNVSYNLTKQQTHQKIHSSVKQFSNKTKNYFVIIANTNWIKRGQSYVQAVYCKPPVFSFLTVTKEECNEIRVMLAQAVIFP